MNYLSIDSDEQIIKLLEQWKINGTQQVAMDFEGEFNLHCYGEHLCLIQIFDGQNFYLIDPLSADELASEKNAKNLGKPFVPFANSSTRNNVTENGLRLLLESPQIEKIWFDCASDGELVWKKFGIRLTRVYDLFKLARVLGLVGIVLMMPPRNAPFTYIVVKSGERMRFSQKSLIFFQIIVDVACP